jgi:hypothetical protein
MVDLLGWDVTVEVWAVVVIYSGTVFGNWVLGDSLFLLWRYAIRLFISIWVYRCHLSEVIRLYRPITSSLRSLSNIFIIKNSIFRAFSPIPSRLLPYALLIQFGKRVVLSSSQPSCIYALVMGDISPVHLLLVHSVLVVCFCVGWLPIRILVDHLRPVDPRSLVPILKWLNILSALLQLPDLVWVLPIDIWELVDACMFLVPSI